MPARRERYNNMTYKVEETLLKLESEGNKHPNVKDVAEKRWKDTSHELLKIVEKHILNAIHRLSENYYVVPVTREYYGKLNGQKNSEIVFRDEATRYVAGTGGPDRKAYGVRFCDGPGDPFWWACIGNRTDKHAGGFNKINKDVLVSDLPRHNKEEITHQVQIGVNGIQQVLSKK